jgi:hypothetical protein
MAYGLKSKLPMAANVDVISFIAIQASAFAMYEGRTFLLELEFCNPTIFYAVSTHNAFYDTEVHSVTQSGQKITIYLSGPRTWIGTM